MPTRRRSADEQPGVGVTRLTPFRRPLPARWCPRRLVVVKACCLGDGLMATPVLAALAQSFPGAAVDVATGPWTRPAFARNPNVRALVDTERLLGGRRPTIGLLARVLARLRAGRYDGAVVLERGVWFGLLIWLAGIPVRTGFDSAGRGATHTRPVGVAGVRHEADRYLECAAAIGATAAPRRLTFDPGDAGQAEAARVLADAGWCGEPFALLHPGGGANPGMRLEAKRWPVERFAELARRLEAHGLRPAIVHGPDEVALGRELTEQLGAGALAVGSRLSLAGLGAAAARARVYVGNDTGPTHLAVAVGTPTVAIFGPSDERRYGPWGRWPDGGDIGEAVAEPRLDLDDPAPAWLTRDVAGVGVTAIEAAVERVLARAQPWRSDDGGGR